MNFKEALRQDTNYLRGLGALDKELRNNWIRSNAARLQQARSMLTDDDYKIFAEDLYRLQLWNNLEAENISKGVYGKTFRPTREYLHDYFNKKVEDIEDTLKYHPDLDENNKYVGSQKNTGFSPEMWHIYSSLKDEESKEEFRNKVLTEDATWNHAAAYQAAEYIKSQSNTATTAINAGDVSGYGGVSWASAFLAARDEENPNNVEYLKKHKDKITNASISLSRNLNSEAAQVIYSKSLKKYRESDEYKSSLDNELNAISERWNTEASDGTLDKTQADQKHKEEFLDAVKENPLLAAASGYDPKTEEFSHDKFQQYESLMKDDPAFKVKYLAHRNILAKQVQEGQITEGDYKQSLIDIASDALKDHESVETRAFNNVKSAFTTGVTYTLHKFAPFVNTAEVLYKENDGKVFMDALGNIYSDSEVTANAHYVNNDDADSAVLYRTSNGISINYNKDRDKIFTLEGELYIYQNDDGSFAAVDPNTVDPNDTHLRKVKAVDVKNTPIRTHDLVRLSKDDSGNDLNWAGGLFNEKYLQLADRFNISPWEKEELDYYNNFGYSNYTNIIRPGDDGRDFWAEVIKMAGFAGADILMGAATRGISKVGAPLGLGMRFTRGLELGAGLSGAIGISDSYAQGIFEENLARNQQALQDFVYNKIRTKAEAWADGEGKETITTLYNNVVRNLELEYGRTLSDSEKAQLEMSVRAKVINDKAEELYSEEIRHPDVLKMQEKAVSDAGTSALVDFWGEGVKYGTINIAGFRSWMFKGRNAAQEAALASEKTLFGKMFSRVGKATEADVLAGRAKYVGEVFLKDAWSNMSKGQKALTALRVVGSQAWGGAWTNFTDEMQSAGAKAQNNSMFDAHLDNYNADGAYLFASALASQLKGMQESIFEENTWWAGLIGGIGSITSFGFNPMGVLNLTTKEGREQWSNMSKGEKFNSIFSNSVLTKIYERRAQDAHASQVLDRANALIKSTNGNTIAIINALSSASKIGHSEIAIESEENDVLSLFHTLQAIETFSKTNPGLAELDALHNIKNFKENAEKLSDIEKLSEEDKQHYIEQIKVANPEMTEAQATQELANVSKRAVLMNKTLDNWNTLINSREYKAAASKTEEKSTKQEEMEHSFILEALNDFTLQNMKEREQSIKGSNTIPAIEGIPFEVNGVAFENSTLAAENISIATYGNTKKALASIQEAFKIVQSKLEGRKVNMKKAKENLNFEAKEKELKKQIEEAPTPQEKESLQKQLEDLIRDNNYYNYEINRIESALEENRYEQHKLEKLFEAESIDKETVIEANEILNLDPVSRMRMLDPNNLSNYSKKQQNQIKKATAILTKNGVHFKDVQNQALALSRYQQRLNMLSDLAIGETVTPSFNTRVTNMIDAANEMVHSNIKKYAREYLKIVEKTALNKDTKLSVKLNFLKKFSPAVLRYMKNSLATQDRKLAEEILPLVEAGEQLIDLIYNENYGLKGLTHEERSNLQEVVAYHITNSRTVEELIDNLTTSANENNNPSLITLLDKLSQVYEQQHSTIVESIKEKAERKRLDREAERERKNAEERAIQEAQETPAVGTSEKPRKGEKQLNRGFKNLQNATTPIEKANAISNIEHNVNHGAEISAEEKATLEQAKQELSKQGYEMVDMLGKSYSEGMKVIADFVADDNAPAGSQTITRIIKPQINKDGVMVQAAEIVVTIGPEKESSLSDVSNKSPKEIIQGAKETIMLTQEQQIQPVAERDPHADHYLINGEKYMRVHGAMGDVWVGPNSPNKEANSARSLRNGAIVDGIVRDFFNGIAVTKPDHFSEEAFNSLVASLEIIKEKIKESGEEFLANNLVLYHEFKNGVKIAGEVDIVSIKIVDGKPQYSIYDLKTSAGGKDGKAFNESPFWETSKEVGTRNTVIGTREQYTNQLSLYKLLFDKMFKDKISTLALLPYKLSYDSENTVTSIEKYPGISLTYNPNVEKLVAYQPAIESALNKIQHTYQGIFTKEQLATLKGVISNGIIKGEQFGKDMVFFIQNQGLESKVNEIGSNQLASIIKELKEEVSKINVEDAIKSLHNVPELTPTIETPSELATEQTSVNEYSPEKESFTEPEIDAEFSTVGEDTGSTQLPQSLTVDEVIDDMIIATNEIESASITENSGEVASTIKGNPMNPFVYEDTTEGVADENKQDVQRGVLALKEPKESMRAYNEWMQSRKINLQNLIDDKLSDILSTGTDSNPVKVFFMRVNYNMTAVGNDKMRNHYLLVIEDTPALRSVYTQEDVNKYGDFVSANGGKKYLIIGTAGFANPAQGNAYRKILTEGPNSVQVRSNEYFRNNPDAEFYVDQEKYTHVAKIHSGFMIKQQVGDSMAKKRKLSELLESESRNPHGLTWESLVFGYQMRNRNYRTVPESDPNIYKSPLYADQNVGNVFVHIKGVDGKYPPVMLIPTRYLEIEDGTLKQKIDTALRNLVSVNHRERYTGLLELFNLVVIGQKDHNGIITGTDILIGTESIPTLTFKQDGNIIFHTDVRSVNFKDVLKGFADLNPRISVTKSKLLNESSLKELDAAGALRTDIARLGKASGDFQVYTVGADGKPIITDTSSTSSRTSTSREKVSQVRIANKYYTRSGKSFIDETGNTITDSNLIDSIILNEIILNNGLTSSVRLGNTEYFVQDSSTIIAREDGTYNAHIVTDAAEITKVKEAIVKKAEKAAKDAREKAAAAELEGSKPIVETAPTTPTVATPTTPINPKTSVMDFLDMDRGASVKATPETIQDHVQITNTSNGMATILPLNEWNRHVADARTKVPSYKTGWYEHGGLTYYVKFEGVRQGDNVAVWFKEAPSDKVKQQIEMWVKNTQNLGDFDTLSRIINGETVYSAPSESTTTQDINVVERKSLVENLDSGKNSTFAEKTALEILTDPVLEEMALDTITTIWPETGSMTMNQIVEFLNSKGKQTTGIKDPQAWIDTLKC